MTRAQIVDIANDSFPDTSQAGSEEILQYLATLDGIEYDQRRESAAKDLQIRTSTLDKEVARYRASEHKEIFGLVEPWAEPVDGARVVEQASEYFDRHMALRDGVGDVAALWAAHTHCFESFEHTPRLNITAPQKQCGKTVMLDILAGMTPRSIRTENVSTAVVFRLIDKSKPTLLVDEYDSFLKDKEELRGALNAGHKRGAQHLRCEGDSHEVKAFETFAPVALAGIGNLPGTLHDRSIVIRLERALPGEVKEPFDSRKTGGLIDINRKLSRWARDHAGNLRKADPEMPGLFNRVADNWRPLVAIADELGGKWPERARELAKKFTEGEEQDDASIRLLKDIRVVFDEREQEKITSANLVEKLVSIEESPWAEWKRGQPATMQAVSRLLKPFGISPKTIRLGQITKKGYEKRQFSRTFARYLGNLPVTTSHPNVSRGSSRNHAVTSDQNVTGQNRLKPNNGGDCYGVTPTDGVFGEEEEKTVLNWLDYIGEHDASEREKVLYQCRIDSGARKAHLTEARKVLERKS